MNKKLKLIVFTAFVLLFQLSLVYADSVTYNNFYSHFDLLDSYYTTYSSNITTAVNYWQEHYSSDYPYYYVILGATSNTADSDCRNGTLSSCDIRLYYSSSPSITTNFTMSSYSFSSPVFKCSDGTTSCTINKRYTHIKVTSNGSLTDYNLNNSYDTIPYTTPAYISGISSGYQNYLTALSSNGLIFQPDSNITSINIPSFTYNNFSFNSYIISEGSLLPDYSSLSVGGYDPSNSSYYTEVDLNQYSYIILSLKSYNTTPFSTTIYTLGPLCLTPVYNYGMKQKNEYLNGFQTQACTTPYTAYTPVSVYIIQYDIDYHSVYYIKSYSSSITNKVKIPTSIFDITYITSENEDNPSVVIDGRSYPTIPYSDLTDTAQISTDTGYISGQVCALGDLNCMEQATGVSFDDIFTHPLQMLTTVWSSIVNFFAIITSFITLLPVQLQTFLYLSFMLAIILGLIKLVLGG